MLFVALSCLQGRPMQEAATELLELGGVDLQLTAGCAPTEAFDRWIEDTGLQAPTHHGFDLRAVRTTVWDGTELTGFWDSVHPPKRKDAELDAVFATASVSGAALEVMYPGYMLGSGADIAAAMSAGVRLAVDVSHVFIQLSTGAMSESDWQRLQDYDLIAEVHVSSNDGRRDQHRALDASTFGLDFARDRLRSGTPVIVESYLHRASPDERRRMLDLVRT